MIRLMRVCDVTSSQLCSGRNGMAQITVVMMKSLMLDGGTFTSRDVNGDDNGKEIKKYIMRYIMRYTSAQYSITASKMIYNNKSTPLSSSCDKG